MEDQERTVAVMSRSEKFPSTGWLVAPVFDLLFFANLGWLLLLLPGFATSSDTAIDFWQIYFLTLPHRWITLILVLTDPDRSGGLERKQITIAALAAMLVVGSFIGTSTFLCLAMIDYLWNSWHFASQHAGVLRIYTKKVGGGVPWLERWGLRFFIAYAALRAAGWTTGWIEVEPDLLQLLHAGDWFVLMLPLSLVVTNLTGFCRERFGKFAYLLSVCTLYTGFLLSLHFSWSRWIGIFAAAGSMFHAVEYLAIVTHYAQRRRSTGSQASFRFLARYWTIFLGLYMLLLGSLGIWMSNPEHGLVSLWQGLNLWAAFVHYAYDGMIWKLRRPETAAALGVGPP